MTAALEALAARVEAATGADRELDAEIGRATGWRHHCDTERWGVGAPHWFLNGKTESDLVGHHLYGNGARLPFFTASLDAAMTLVPEGWHGSIDFNLTGPGVTGAGVCIYAQGDWHASACDGAAATPALALTAASLRARAILTETNDVG